MHAQAALGSILAAFEPTDVTGSTQAEAADPLVTYLTLGIAVLSIAGTIWVGVRQVWHESNQWLREQRQQTYSAFLTQLGVAADALSESNATRSLNPVRRAKTRARYAEEYAHALKKLDEHMSGLTIIGSVAVQTEAAEALVFLKLAQRQLHTELFEFALFGVTTGQQPLGKFMAHDVKLDEGYFAHRKYAKNLAKRQKLMEETIKNATPVGGTAGESAH